MAKNPGSLVHARSQKSLGLLLNSGSLNHAIKDAVNFVGEDQ